LQSDATFYELDDGSKVEILNFIDDFSRVGVASRVLSTTRSLAGRQVRVLDEQGELLRELVLDPDRDYQPRGRR